MDGAKRVVPEWGEVQFLQGRTSKIRPAERKVRFPAGALKNPPYRSVSAGSAEGGRGEERRNDQKLRKVDNAAVFHNKQKRYQYDTFVG